MSVNKFYGVISKIIIDILKLPQIRLIGFFTSKWHRKTKQKRTIPLVYPKNRNPAVAEITDNVWLNEKVD